MSETADGDGPPAVRAALRRGFKLKLAANEDSPLIILLGWHGCKDRYLSKYGSLVSDLGYSQLRAILPSEHIWWPWDGGRTKFTRMLMDVLLDTGLCPRRQVVLYAFSNGGAFVIEEMYKLFRSTTKYHAVQRSISGLVFDSAPSYLYASTLHQSSVVSVRGGYARWMWPLLSAVVWLLVGLTLFMSGLLDGWRPTRRVQYWNWFKTVDFKVPQLWLYAAGDPLCDCAQLEKLIAARKARGDAVQSHRWQDSEHVGHYKRCAITCP
ncbi:hypothetical protein WJX73_008510 [Symbiochloris irregularis]|uniref:Transmembrane protein 53 n=1 Tax=Symbiochloris irregularis TaxID=706552 RepID=A0AAW1NUF6_9CHLO